MGSGKRLKIAALLVVLSVFIPAPAESQDGVDFNIRFFDRRVYYVQSSPILVQITITNNSPQPFHFRLAEERAFSVNFEARTMANMPLEPAQAFIRRRTQSQQVFFREIAVGSGESFSFVEDLRDYINFANAGSFIVQARIYPGLYRQAAFGDLAPLSIASNRLNLNLRPDPVIGLDGIPVAMDVETGAILVRERLAPDQVVEFMILARQRSQWERFFLYLDLEAMLANDPFRRQMWLAESEAGRQRMVAEFRAELQQPVIGGISVIPSSFNIERTSFNPFEGTVTVFKRFSAGTFTILRRYVYDVEFRDNAWLIVNYSVTNLGTE
ncbi:MAG: hypothetical protein FWG66_06670 [Spirochaetes bacterium]|nr:hypothetical protein [Spirochaetota bacterium]